MSRKTWQAVADASDAIAVEISGIPASGEGYDGFEHSAESEAELAEAHRLLEKAFPILKRTKHREAQRFGARQGIRCRASAGAPEGVKLWRLLAGRPFCSGPAL